MYKFTIVISTLLVLITSCKSPDQKVEAAKDNVIEATKDLDVAKEEYIKQYNAFLLESNQKITDNDNTIAQLKKDASNVKKDVKAEYNKTIASLEQKNIELKAKARDYKEDTKENWESFKKEFNHDMDELGKALKDLTKNNVK
ncbi:MAG: peptidase M23 [Saprospiraceae bacterium]